MRIKFRVRDDLARWGCSAGTFESGEQHELEVDATAVKEFIAAEAAGALSELVDVSGGITADLLEVVERQDISEQKLEAAMADGRWQEGHLQQFELDAEYAEIEIGGGA